MILCLHLEMKMFTTENRVEVPLKTNGGKDAWWKSRNFPSWRQTKRQDSKLYFRLGDRKAHSCPSAWMRLKGTIFTWTCLLVFIQSVASVTVAVIRATAVIHTDVLAIMRAQGTLVKNWPGLGQEREYSQITIGNDTDFWEKEALVWSQRGLIWILQSSESPMFQKEGASSWSLPHSPFLAISCKYFGFCLFFFAVHSPGGLHCILILSQNLPLAFP